jgi:hypothetical protein
MAIHRDHWDQVTQLDTDRPCHGRRLHSEPHHASVPETELPSSALDFLLITPFLPQNRLKTDCPIDAKRLCRRVLTDDPFCTVLLGPVSEAIDVSKGQFPRQTRRPNLPSRKQGRPRHRHGLPGAPVVFIKIKLQSAPVAFGYTAHRRGSARSGDFPRPNSGLGALRWRWTAGLQIEEKECS